MKTCFLFPGQGAQYPAMGKELYDESEEVRNLFDIAEKASGKDVTSLMFESDEATLKETENTQIVITLMNLALRRYLKERKGIESAGAAGFSLGEWSAYVDTGVLTESDVFPVVIKRAELMAQAAKEEPKLEAGSAMAAVVGLSPDKVEEILADKDDVYPANYNSPVQTVISGTKPAVDGVMDALKEAGAKRVIPLKVSGPFHTPLLQAASDRFAEYLEGVNFNAPNKPLYSNVGGAEVSTVDEIRKNAALQMVSPVRWTEEMNAINSSSYERCIECGPGKVLTGLWKRIDSDISCIPGDNSSEREKL